jgi:hypothetical protein
MGLLLRGNLSPAPPRALSEPHGRATAIESIGLSIRQHSRLPLGAPCASAAVFSIRRGLIVGIDHSFCRQAFDLWKGREQGWETTPMLSPPPLYPLRYYVLRNPVNYYGTAQDLELAE